MVQIVPLLSGADHRISFVGPTRLHGHYCAPLPALLLAGVPGSGGGARPK